MQSRKSYCETEKVCEDARSKFTEAETRLKKKDVKFFESVSSLEKTHKKCSDRLKACQKRTTVARNDYLLSLSSTNAHLQQHATKDFPQIMLVSRCLEETTVLMYSGLSTFTTCCLIR